MISVSTVLPSFAGNTQSEVPHRITSPGANVMSCETRSHDGLPPARSAATLIQIKVRWRRRCEDAAMLHRIIAIVPVAKATAAWVAPLLSGQPDQVQRVLAALEHAVETGLGHTMPAARWLRELRLGGGEAFVSVAPGLGHDSQESAEIAFCTLRRLLPDTDIYVSAAVG